MPMSFPEKRLGGVLLSFLQKLMSQGRSIPTSHWLHLASAP